MQVSIRVNVWNIQSARMKNCGHCGEVAISTGSTVLRKAPFSKVLKIEQRCVTC